MFYIGPFYELRKKVPVSISEDQMMPLFLVWCEKVRGKKGVDKENSGACT